MTPILSLDSLTLTDTRPQDAIRAAATAGFGACSLWVQAPALYPSRLLTLGEERRMRGDPRRYRPTSDRA